MYGDCCGYRQAPDLMSPSQWGWRGETVISCTGTSARPVEAKANNKAAWVSILVLNTTGVVSSCLALPALCGMGADLPQSLCPAFVGVLCF